MTSVFKALSERSTHKLQETQFIHLTGLKSRVDPAGSVSHLVFKESRSFQPDAQPTKLPIRIYPFKKKYSHFEQCHRQNLWGRLERSLTFSTSSFSSPQISMGQRTKYVLHPQVSVQSRQSLTVCWLIGSAHLAQFPDLLMAGTWIMSERWDSLKRQHINTEKSKRTPTSE